MTSKDLHYNIDLLQPNHIKNTSKKYRSLSDKFVAIITADLHDPNSKLSKQLQNAINTGKLELDYILESRFCLFDRYKMYHYVYNNKNYVEQHLNLAFPNLSFTLKFYEVPFCSLFSFCYYPLGLHIIINSYVR